MENVHEHVDFELVNNIRYEKCVSSPTFKYQHYIHDQLVGIEKTKPVVMLNKPIYAGFTILELSKLHMYQYYYDVLKPRYGNNIELGYTDTYSFVIYVKTEDVDKDLKEMNEYMDFRIIQKTILIMMLQTKKLLANLKMR